MFEKLKFAIGEIMYQFYPIGSNEDSKGVTRLGYTEVEDEMHERFLQMARRYNLKTEVDEIGNSYAYIGDFKKYHLIGSHLDSVIQGGRYDGVAGVAIGLGLLKILKEENIDIPVKVVAFRNEESASFMTPLIGSGLITGVKTFEEIKDVKNQEGKTLDEIFTERYYSKNPKLLDGVLDYIEVHIEQGRVLESNHEEIGIVSTIAGAVKAVVEIRGLAEHAGATPMDLRRDSLVAASEVILETEKLGKTVSEFGVATVGYMKNSPNSLNVIPGKTKISLDIRDIEENSLDKMVEGIKRKVEEVAKDRDLNYDLKVTSSKPPVYLSERMIKEFTEIAEENGFRYRIMASGAGHDCMNVQSLYDSALIFIPCKDGISHNPDEFTTVEDMARGGELIYNYLQREETNGGLRC